MNIFQTPEWEKFKIATGYRKSHRVDGILVLEKNLLASRSMLYSPLVDQSQIDGIKFDDYISKIKDIAKAGKSIFYRLELDIPDHNSESNIHNSQFIIHNSGFMKSFEEMQPVHTIVLDLEKSEEEILAQMKPKGRYNIKVAERHNVSIKEEKNIDNFYRFYSGMAKRQKITFRDKNYFQNLIDNLMPKDYCKVLTAYAGETPIASTIVTFYSDTAIYLFGGSGNEFRNLMAPYLLQWHAIKMAKDRGMRKYDFFGVAPEDSPNHPWSGVTKFKEQFGGARVKLLGSWDLVFKPSEYKLFKIAEKIRRK